MPASTLHIGGGQLVLVTPDVAAHAYVSGLPGVTRETRAGADVLVKRFPCSRFLHTEGAIAEAVRAHRAVADIVYGMSGYSDLSPERCAALHIRPGQYESATFALFRATLEEQCAVFSGVRMALVFGSSEVGVDRMIRRVAHEKRVPLLGFTCADYLWWVDNAPQGPTICVCKSKVAYAWAYVDALDILFAANGGETSYRMDTYAAFLSRVTKPVIFLNVLRLLNARVAGFASDGKVLDAVAAFEERVHLITRGTTFLSDGGDRFREVEARLRYEVAGIMRNLLPPEVAFQTLV